MSLAHLYPRIADAIAMEHLSTMRADSNYTHILFADGSRRTFSYTLRRFEELYPNLIRINKCLLVNQAVITNWKQVGINAAQITIGDTIHPVSRRRVRIVAARLMACQSSTP
jgi:DNA-binding LytR/AlgR family response regulator